MILRELERPDLNHLLELIERHLEEETSIISTIIKGHLLVEHTMNVALEILTDGYKKYRPKGPKFADKIRYCDMFGLFVSNPQIYEQMELLNKLRNGIAHNLTYDMNEIRMLYGYHKQNFHVYDGILDEERKELKKLSHCMMAIAGHLLAATDFKVQLNNYCFRTLPTTAEGHIDKQTIGYHDQFREAAEYYGKIYNIEVDEKGNMKERKQGNI